MLKGIGVSGGYGIGNVVLLSGQDLSFEAKTDCDPNTEKHVFTRHLNVLPIKPTPVPKNCAKASVRKKPKSF